MNAPPPEPDIDTRILNVEHRLMAREARLHAGVEGLTGQLRHRLQPKKLLLPVGGALLGIAALLALRRQPQQRQAEPATPRPAGALRNIPWVRLLGLAWPLLPERWRGRVSPAAASSFVTLGLPLVETLLGTRRSEPLATVAEVDLAQLSGRWFVVGELKAHGAPALQPPEFGLLPRDDGRLDLLERRVDRSGTHGSEALVEPVPGSHGARLRISHWPEALRWLPLAWLEHGVLHIDPAYDEALIGSTGRDALWLLSRRPALPPERRQALLQVARDRGFAAEKLHFYDDAG